MYSAAPRSTHLAGLAASHSSGAGVAALVVIALFLLSMAIPVMLLVRPLRSDDGGDGDSGSDGGWDGPGGRGPNDPGPTVDEPVLWPEFERQFADYVTSTTERKQEVQCSHGQLGRPSD